MRTPAQLRRMVVAVAVIALTMPGAARASQPETVSALAATCVAGTDYTTTTSAGYVTITFTNTTTSCDYVVPTGVTSIDYLVVGV